ncbi:MAG: hypothetical protein ABEJ91_02670 [Candidatus Nanohaloarchaea archaeon]
MGSAGSSSSSRGLLEREAVSNDWGTGSHRLVYVYEPRGEVYDSNQETERKYDPVIRTGDFRARVYLQPDEEVAKVNVNLGRAGELFYLGFYEEADTLGYRVTSEGIEASIKAESDPARAVEELEKLAELLSQASMEDWVRTSERLEWKQEPQ